VGKGIVLNAFILFGLLVFTSLTHETTFACAEKGHIFFSGNIKAAKATSYSHLFRLAVGALGSSNGSKITSSRHLAQFYQL